MEKQKIKDEKKSIFVTQHQYIEKGPWVDRFEYGDLPSAQSDLKFVKGMVPRSGLKYRYRLIKREISLVETLEEE